MALEAVAHRKVKAVRPRVRLVAWTHEPYRIAVASARTCYAADFVFVGRLSPKGERTRITLEDAFPQETDLLDRIAAPTTAHDERLRLVAELQERTEDAATRDAVAVFADLARQRAETDDRIASSIYEAGHHTPFQHPTFVFAVEDVSRNAVESFFHNHNFYNSEQQSQRYVRMKDAEVVVPPGIQADDDARPVYEAAVAEAYGAYDDLRERLVAANERTMAAIGRIKGQSEKQIRSEAEKKSQEMARYVMPVAAATRLYHTVSGIVLLRYMRMAEASNCPAEVADVVGQMAAAVREADPEFLDKIQEQALPASDHVETALLAEGGNGAATEAAGDADPIHTSTLLNATPDAPALVARVLREVTGSMLPDDELLERVLDPALNGVWNDTLNTWDHSPALRALHHVHYTFSKRQSLTAFAQDQRHRTTPGARPRLELAVRGPAPDVYTPDIIAADPEAKDVYVRAIEALWMAIGRLRAMGIPEHELTYLLPNATNVHYTQSGDLLAWIHKWRLRLCFNAQKEIFEAALDELRQVQAVHPELTRFIGPPCSFVAARVPVAEQDSVEACCPEGPRWCGVKVWKNFDAAAGKPKRPY